MKKNYSTTIYLPVVSVVGEIMVAVPNSFVIDWKDFHIVALWAKIGLRKKKLILWQDILELSNAWYIQSEESFSEPDELVRLTDILEKHFDLKKAVCRTESDVFVGKISDFTFDLTTGQITNIMVVNHQIRPLAHELMLPITQVIKAEDGVITIRDLETPIEIKADTTEAILPVPNYV